MGWMGGMDGMDERHGWMRGMDGIASWLDFIKKKKNYQLFHNYPFSLLFYNQLPSSPPALH